MNHGEVINHSDTVFNTTIAKIANFAKNLLIEIDSPMILVVFANCNFLSTESNRPIVSLTSHYWPKRGKI